MTATDQPHQLQLNGGVFPEPDGSWRIVLWVTGARTEAEAHNLSGQIQARLAGQPAAGQQPVQPNGGQPQPLPHGD